VVLVVMEHAKELFLRHFRLVTSWTPDEKGAHELVGV
jgi:hypothetical protein